MKILGKVALFALTAVAAAALGKIGEHVGDAVGVKLGRKIDANHGKTSPAEGAAAQEVPVWL